MSLAFGTISVGGLDLACRFAAGIRRGGKKISHTVATVVEVRFEPSYEGQYEDTLELTFLDLARGERFVITRSVLAVVGSRELHERLKPTGPYVRPKTSRHDQPKRVVEHRRPSKWSHTKWVVKLPDFAPQPDLINAAFGPKPSAAVKPFIPTFDLDNYAKFWQALIWIEETKMQ